MYAISETIDVIDTPGIKSFGLVDIDKSVLGHYFPEMRAVMDQCKFHNCQHLNEPKCAVIEAVESGAIAQSRYQNYLTMLTDEEDMHWRKNKYT